MGKHHNNGFEAIWGTIVCALENNGRFVNKVVSNLIKRPEFQKMVRDALRKECEVAVEERAMRDTHCPECGKILRINCNKSKPQYFVSCTGYPDCNYTRPLRNGDEQRLGISQAAKNRYDSLCQVTDPEKPPFIPDCPDVFGSGSSEEK